MTASELSALFDDGSAEFARWTPLLWGPIGRSLVDLCRPRAGERVLDACCGAGSSALPAAAEVGPGGWVDAVDLAEGLLARGRTAAGEAGLANVRFVRADVTRWDGGEYDLVQCGFGVFFLPDMDSDGERMVELLRPGGRFGLTSWAEGSLESVFRPFFAAAVEQLPELAAREKPRPTANSERLLTETAVRDWLLARGLRDPEVHRHELDIPLDGDLAWQLLLSGPAKAVLTGLSEQAIARVRESFNRRLAAEQVRSLHAPFIAAVATKPADRVAAVRPLWSPRFSAR